MSVGIRFGSRSVLLVGSMLMAQAVMAHTGHGDHHGLVTGFMHPFSGLDHLLAMVAVGIGAMQPGSAALWTLPLVFPLAMAAGVAMGASGLALPGVETGIAVSSLILGVMVVARIQMPVIGAAAMIATLALFHGYAHGLEMPAGAIGWTYGACFVVGTLLLHLAGIAMGSLHRFGVGASALRGIGAGIAGAGTLLLVQALA